MGKIGRRRKYSHWKYTEHHPTGNTQTKSSPPVVPSYNVPIEYQFPLRHLPSAVFTSLPFTTILKFCQFCQKIMSLKTLGMQSSMLNFSLCYAPSAKSTMFQKRQ